MAMKPKVNRKNEDGKSSVYDQCQTPGYAFGPLKDILPKDSLLWDTACGEGNLVRMMKHCGFNAYGSDILTGSDFFDFTSRAPGIIQVTNFPFTKKFPWLEHSYALGMPFALLAPIEIEGAARAQRLFQKHGVEIIYTNPRINFKMPSHKTWEETLVPTIVTDDEGNIVYRLNPDGSFKLDKKGEKMPKKTSGAQFPVAWYTWGLKIGRAQTWNVQLDRVLQPWERKDYTGE